MKNLGSGKEKISLKEIIIGLSLFIMIIVTVYIILPTMLRTDTPLAYISSSSMEPTYYVGDLVIIAGVKGDEINIGDVIVFKPSNYGKLILHRVIAKKYEDGKFYFLTKGDNPRTNPYTDAEAWGWISEDNIKGKLVGRIPFVGYIFMALSTIIGKVILFILLLSILISGFPEKKQNSKPIISKFSKKIFILGIIFSVSIFGMIIAFSNYLYIGPEKADVELISIGEPREQLTFRVYPLILKVESYGLTGGSVKFITIYLVKQSDNQPIYTCAWSIVYVFIGEKKISLPLLLNSSSPIDHYNLVITFHIEKLGGKIFVENKTIYDLIL